MNRAEYEEQVSKCSTPVYHDTHRYCPSCPWTEEGPIDGFDDEPARWKPRYLVQKAPGVGGDPIPKDEPVLVIRAQDVLAEEMCRYYIDAHRRLPGYSEAVELEMYDHYGELRRWRDENRRKIKVPDR